MRLAYWLVKWFAADCFRHESETAIQRFVAYKLSLFAVDDVDHGLAERLSVLGVELSVEAVLSLATSARLGIAWSNI